MQTPGEKQPREHTWSLFTLLMVLFAAAILGDSTAESLLLSHVDMRLIPNMFLVNAVFLFLTSTLLMSVIDRADRGIFFIILVFAHCLVLFLVREALHLHASILYPILFSYAYVSKIILFLLFWTMANDLIDSRNASVRFPFIAAGGTLGAIVVSFTIPWLLKVIAAENLLFVWAALVAVLGVFFVPVRQSFGTSLMASSDKEKHASRNIKNLGHDLKLVYQEPLLSSMALFYFILFFILINQHYSFYGQLKSRFVNAKELASFLGYFNGCSMFVTFALQAAVAGPVLKKIGSTRSMLFLPAVLCLVFVFITYLGCAGGSVALQVKGAGFSLLFWSVVAGMGLRTAFFDSFFSPNFQVFFSSLPHDVRGRGKLALEGVVKPLAIMAASIWLLFIVPKVSFGLYMAILSLLAMGMVFQTLKIRKKYTESLTQNLTGMKSKQLPKLFNFVNPAQEESFYSLLARLLENEEYEIKKYIIDLLVDTQSKESIALLLDYLNRCDDICRATIISSLARLKQEAFKDLFVRHLTHGDRRVVANSVLALAEYRNGEINEGLEVFLHSPDNRIRTNAIIVLWPGWPPERRKRLRDLLLEMLSLAGTNDCLSALYAMRTMRSPEFLPHLKEFAARESERIVADSKLWKQYISAQAAIAAEESLGLLLEFADKVNRKKTADVVAALGRLIDGGYPVEGIVRELPGMNYRRRGILLDVFRQRQNLVGKEHDEMLRRLAHEEVAAVYEHWACLHLFDSGPKLPGVHLLRMAVFEECIDRRLRNVISLCSLLDKSGQIGRVAHRFHHANRHVRARALEVLDNTGDAKVNRRLLRLLDAGEAAVHFREAADFKGAKSLREVIVDYANDCHEWVRQCSAYAAENLFATSNDPGWQNVTIRSEGCASKG